MWELWHIPTGNIMAAFNTKAELDKCMKNMLAKYGEHYLDDTGVVYEAYSAISPKELVIANDP